MAACVAGEDSIQCLEAGEHLEAGYCAAGLLQLSISSRIENMPADSFATTKPASRRQPIAVWGLLLTAAVILLRPAVNSDFWWNLARGRQVFAGSWTPSADLLVADSLPEADWLGGALHYFLLTLAGVWGVTTLPVLATAVALLLLVRSRNADHWLVGIIFLLWMPALRVSLQSSGSLMDVLAMVVLWHMLVGLVPGQSAVLKTAGLFCLWSNLGPGMLWGLWGLVAFFPRRQLSWQVLLAAGLGGMVNPRGLLAWRDAVLNFAPGLLAGASWGVLPEHQFWSVPGQAQALVSWGLLLAFAVSSRWLDRREPEQWLRWGAPVLSLVMNPMLLPMSALWIGLDACSAEHPFPWPQQRRWPALRIAAAGIVGLVILLDAGGMLDTRLRLGWGIASQLDYRLLDDRLVDIGEGDIIGYTPDARSAGAVAWLQGKVHPEDIPRRALLGGRWRQNALLLDDLMHNRGSAFRRADGTWGGWMAEMDVRHLLILFLPYELEQLHEALGETEWKAADVDSPVVPYVSADDLRFIPPIVDTMRQLSLVESGPWHPGQEIFSTHGIRVDVREALGLGGDPGTARLQSRIFRSLQTPLAAVRVLLPFRRMEGLQVVRNEFLQAQLALAEQDWLQTGASTRWSRAVIHRLTSNENIRRRPSLEVPDASRENALPAGWQKALDSYLQGRLQQAIEDLSSQTDEERIARCMLWLEMGEPAQALAEVKEIDSEQASRVNRVTALHWRLILQDSSPRKSP